MITTEQALQALQRCGGNKSEAARKLGVTRHALRWALERKLRGANQLPRSRYGARVHLPILNGCVMVVSDQHYWPNELSVAHKAALAVGRRVKPWAIISNGDTLDGASISRWPASSFINLEGRPTVADELEVSKRRLLDFERLGARWLLWCMGNHDARYETYLATNVPQYSGVDGFHLKDHFPQWLPAWSVWIGDQVVVKHSIKSGQYAAGLNTIYAGRSTVVGHDHTLWAKAFSDYNGMRWGIGAGTLADVNSEAFLHYTEDNPVNWQSGFVLLHFKQGRFIGPELVYVLPDGKVPFRGEWLRI